MSKILYSSLLVGFLFLAAGCNKETDADKIADAQSCLDRATAPEAAACVSKVDGLESEGAYLIRCAGKFVKEGFNNATKLSGALANISGDNNGGATGSLAMMSALTFTTESTPALNAASSDEAAEFCTKSKSKGLIFLAGLTKIATSMWSVAEALSLTGSGTPPTAAELATLMTNLAGNTEAQTAVGSAVVAIYDSSCNTSNVSAPGNYCQQFRSAVTTVSGGTDNPAGIGQQLMLCYTTPTAPGCSGF